jgi:hypothetical protein
MIAIAKRFSPWIGMFGVCSGADVTWTYAAKETVQFLAFVPFLKFLFVLRVNAVLTFPSKA